MSPTWFMSDSAPQFYNAFCDVNECTPLQLFYTWHVDKRWKEQLREKIGNLDVYKEVYKRLRTVLEEPNCSIFENRVAVLKEHLLQANVTKDFGRYFESFWMSKTRSWAYCYRKGYGINTNMYVEAFHRVFKYEYKGKGMNRRVDKCLLSLIKFNRDKAFDRIIKLTKGKATKKLKDIQESHDASLTLSFDSVSVLSNTEWRITSGSSKNTSYTLYLCGDCNDQACKLKCIKCNICRHKYTCSCNDFMLKKTICKHVHLLERYKRKDNVDLQDKKERSIDLTDDIDDVVRISQSRPPKIGNFKRQS